MKWNHIIISTFPFLCTGEAFLPAKTHRTSTSLHSKLTDILPTFDKTSPKNSNAPTATTTAMSAAAEIRAQLVELLGKNPSAHKDLEIRSQFAAKLEEYSNAEGCDPSDVVFAIGQTVFGVEVPPPAKKSKTGNGSAEEKELPVVDFDYMKAFMNEVFVSYGVTPERAEICADVLIESDKRGIDSHGLGRLKPIYCDRMDDGILFPDKPIDIVSESDTTALVGEFLLCSFGHEDYVVAYTDYNRVITLVIRWQPWTGIVHWTILHANGN
jgi:hypothetical protein